MKLLLLSLAMLGVCCLAAHVVPKDQNINDMLIEIIEKFKQTMTCGAPDLGIPVLAPFEYEHVEFTIDQTGFYFDGEMNEILVDGLNEFDIKKIDVQILKLQLNFEFLFHSIRTKGKYAANGKALGFIPFDRSGPFTFNFNGLSIEGSIKLALKDSKVVLTELQISPIVQSVESNLEKVFLLPLNTFLFNRIVETVIPNVLSENRQAVTDFLEDLLKPSINDLLKDFTLDDLLGMITGNSSLPTTC